MSEEFKKGAKTMFDYILMATANHYHMNPTINKQCAAEAAYATDLAADALREVAPELHGEWLSLVELQQINVELRKDLMESQKENQRLKAMLNTTFGDLISKFKG